MRNFGFFVENWFQLRCHVVFQQRRGQICSNLCSYLVRVRHSICKVERNTLTISSSSLIASNDETNGVMSTSSGFEAAPSRRACHSETSFPEVVSFINTPIFWDDVYAARNLGRASLVSFPFGRAMISIVTGLAAFSICPKTFAAKQYEINIGTKTS